MNNIDLEALSDGIESPFWASFCEYVTKEWGPSGLRYQQAVQNASEKAEAVVELQKVLAAQRAVLEIMRHPSEQLQTMRAKAKASLTVGMSRRGAGL